MSAEWQHAKLSFGVNRWRAIRSLLRLWRPATISLEMDTEGRITVSSISVRINDDRALSSIPPTAAG